MVESEFAGRLLDELIEKERAHGQADVYVVPGLTSGYSAARTLLAVERTPVAVFIESGSSEERVAAEQKLRVEEVLGDAAGTSALFAVIMVEPSMDTLFFQSPPLIERVFNRTLDEHLREIAALSPRIALSKLSGMQDLDTTRSRILDALDESDINALRAARPVSELLTFIRSAYENLQRKRQLGRGVKMILPHYPLLNSLREALNQPSDVDLTLDEHVHVPLFIAFREHTKRSPGGVVDRAGFRQAEQRMATELETCRILFEELKKIEQSFPISGGEPDLEDRRRARSEARRKLAEHLDTILDPAVLAWQHAANKLDP
jgi:hypothetical protein